MLKKADIVLGIAILILGISGAAYSLLYGQGGAKAVVKVDGKEYGTYSLSEDKIIKIEEKGHLNVIQIKDGNVAMISSSCKNQLCVNTGRISKTSQAVVCLPNRVMIEIKGKKGEEAYDSVSN